MAYDITPLPGRGCIYYVRGRCLHKMRDNPIFHDEWRCIVIEEWESAFDEYLAQVECFNIDQDTAMNIWARRFSRLMGRPNCSQYKEEDDPVVGCSRLHFDLCLAKTPHCPGRCRHYRIDD